MVITWEPISLNYVEVLLDCNRLTKVRFMTENIASSAGLTSSPPPAVLTATGIPVYVPRFNRTKPVIAIVAENTFTELTDYVIPYGVLSESGVAEVFAIATQNGPITKYSLCRRWKRDHDNRSDRIDPGVGRFGRCDRRSRANRLTCPENRHSKLGCEAPK